MRAPDDGPETHPLDNPVWSALGDGQADLAETRGRARRFRPDVAEFAAVDHLDDGSWADLAGLVGPGRHCIVGRGEVPAPPRGWTEVLRLPGRQLTLAAADLVEAPPVPARPLTDADVPAMLTLTALTEPGPFLARTIEFGGYVGVFEGGRLVAMAGQRLRVGPFTEISAVCTHPDARGRGLARGLVHHVARRIVERGEHPFLHVASFNAAALALYDRMGFTTRRSLEFVLMRTPPA